MLTDAISSSLGRAGFAVAPVEIGDSGGVVATRSEFRWRWFATRLHTFVYVLRFDGTREDAVRLGEASLAHALAHKRGLPRGIQTGVVSVPVLVAELAQDDARTWASTLHAKFAAFLFPVVVETNARRVSYQRKRTALARVYQPFLQRLVADHIEANA